jgi:hypothetical protein
MSSFDGALLDTNAPKEAGVPDCALKGVPEEWSLFEVLA